MLIASFECMLIASLSACCYGPQEKDACLL